MSSDLNPISLILYAHIHATESEEKVMSAIKNLLPKEINFEKLDIKREELRGHHGNLIIRFEIRMRGKDVKLFFDHLIAKLKNQIYPGWFSERFDSKTNKFYLRLDKQSAYLREFRVGTGDDVIKIIFTFPGYVKVEPSKIEEKMLNKSKKMPDKNE